MKKLLAKRENATAACFVVPWIGGLLSGGLLFFIAPYFNSFMEAFAATMIAAGVMATVSLKFVAYTIELGWNDFIKQHIQDDWWFDKG